MNTIEPSLTIVYEGSEVFCIVEEEELHLVARLPLLISWAA